MDVLNLPTAAGGRGDPCLAHSSSSVMDSLTQLNRPCVSPFPPEMLNLDNFDDMSAFCTISPATNSVKGEFTVDLDPILDDLNPKPETLTSNMNAIRNDSISELETLLFQSDVQDGSLCESGLESGCFSGSEVSTLLLDSESFHNIEDYIMQDFSSPVQDDPSDIGMSSPASSLPLEDQSICNATVCTDQIPANNKIKTESKSPHEKYIEMRRKNNIASRRSRQIRKQKNKEMVHTVAELERENVELKRKLEKLEKQKDTLQNYLLKIMKKA